MTYYDHMCCFADRSAGIAAFPHLTALDGAGDPVWTCAVFEPLDLITTEAVWGEPDAETDERALITPQAVLPGYWCIISLHAEDAVIRAHPGCKLIASRQLWAEQSPFGFLTWLNWDTAEFASVLRFTPQIAGVGYPLGA